MGYRVLCLKLWYQRTFKRGATSNQNVGANNSIQRSKIWSWSSVARVLSEVAKQLLLCIGGTQVTGTEPVERRNLKEALPWNHWHGHQCLILSETWSNGTEWNQRQIAMLFTTSSSHKPTWTWKSQKNMQRSIKVSGCSPRGKDSILTRSAAESDRKYFSLPRIANSLDSRHRSHVSSNCCPKQRPPMLTICPERKCRAEDISLRV